MTTDMLQLPIPGVLVLVSTPTPAAIAADNVGWNRAVAQSTLASACKLVAMILASHVQAASEDDRELPAGSAVCAPGLAKLVEQTGYSRTHVQRQLGRLRELGWLGAVGRPAAGRPARFVLTLPEAVARSAGVATAGPAGPAPEAEADEKVAPTLAAVTAEPVIPSGPTVAPQQAEPAAQAPEPASTPAARLVAVTDAPASAEAPEQAATATVTPLAGRQSEAASPARAADASARDDRAGATVSDLVAGKPLPGTETSWVHRRLANRGRSPRKVTARSRAAAAMSAAGIGSTATAGFGRPTASVVGVHGTAAPPRTPVADAAPPRPTATVGTPVGPAPEPAVAADPARVAASQVIAILARAYRCEPEDFADTLDQIHAVISDGSWTAPTLATHLVHLMVGGVSVGLESPSKNLGWRLTNLPRTCEACPCGACRSWRAEEAATAARNRDPNAAPVIPTLSDIERAAAIGAEQAKALARARAS